MPSGVTLAKSFYCSLIYHFHYFRALIGYFTQICPVDVILNIFSICLQFHCYLLVIGSLLMYLDDFLISLNIFHSTFYFAFHCVYLEIFMDPGVIYVPRCIQYSP
jgi:hypothetical protein